MNREGERVRDAEVKEKLLILIEAEPDPKERARLMIMMQISDILIDNVRAVRGLSDEMHSHRVEFADHIKKELEYINQGKGMWRVLAVVLSIAQAIIGYSFWTHVEDMRDMQAAVQRLDKRMGLIEDRYSR